MLSRRAGLSATAGLSSLPARCYASAGQWSSRHQRVRPSVRHAPVLCQNEER